MARATDWLCRWASISLLAAATAGAALAEATPPNRDQQVTPPNPQQQLETQGQSQPSENLTERLERSQGVITPPPSGDRDMHITPPNPDSKMPVIPPPGTRDGDTTVQPK